MVAQFSSIEKKIFIFLKRNIIAMTNADNSVKNK